jgi:hypothetical protein
MIRKPKLGMKVRLLKSDCCFGRHIEGEIGEIVYLALGDRLLVSVNRPNGAWWHRRECVEEVKETKIKAQDPK